MGFAVSILMAEIVMLESGTPAAQFALVSAPVLSFNVI